MEQRTFEIPASYRKWTMGLIIVGLVAVLYGFIMYHPFAPVAHHGAGGHADTNSTRFWAVLLQNATFWLLTCNASMFFIAVTTMAHGGWQVAFRRIPEAISSVVPILGIITLVILAAIIFGGRSDIYHWLDKDAVAHDKILKGKSGFLNAPFYMLWSVLSIGLWSFLGSRIRRLSQQTDETGTLDYGAAKGWIWKNTVVTSLFAVVFGLTVASTIPWLWLMSIDAHWYSTMYSWYTFASTFVAGLSLMAIFVVFMRDRGYLEFVTEEHLHDIGKFMFAFSIFWTYLWFSQYMLIWYSNQTEETRYFVDRIGTAERKGPFTGIFFLNLFINFLCPLLIFMKKSSKRSGTLMVFVALLIIFGHWLDFYQMVMPGTLHEHAQMLPFEFGVPALFIGIIMWGVGRYLSTTPVNMMNHPYMKESIIHHT